MASLLLEEMRLAWGKGNAKTPGEIQAAEWLAQDPKGFRTYFAALERQDSGGEGPVDPGQAWDGSGVCPTCHRPPEVKITSEAALAAAKDWLEKNK